VPDEHIQTMRGQATWAARRAAAHTIPRELRSVNELPSDFRDRFAAIDVPVLLLIGSVSPPFLTEPSRVLAGVLPHAEVAVFDGHAHSAMDTTTHEFVQRVTAFGGRWG
jgi:pimeloyl-ACP methyl ester carboxylesterase